MDYRIFQLNNEFCIVHYPDKPNGFGVLIIGGEEQFVDSKKSNWLENYNRMSILQSLMEEGYTVFYTNFGKKHMGNEKTKELVKDLYEHIKRTEILNDKVHIIAEGIGTLIASDFLKNKPKFIRSIALINPVFSLSWVVELLKNQPFLYKRVIEDICAAYGIEEDKCESFIESNDPKVYYIENPYIIIHILEHGIQDREWIPLYKKHFTEQKGNIHVILPEKRSRISYYAKKLFKQAEFSL